MTDAKGILPNNSGTTISRVRLNLKIILKCLLTPVGFLLPREGTGLRVLFYHRVNSFPFAKLGMVSREISVQEKMFERQLAYLARRGFRSVDLAEFEKVVQGILPADPKAVLITFDDGYTDNLEVAAPLLKKYGFTAVVFLVSGMIGKTNQEWPMSDPPEFGKLMNEDQIWKWLSEGHEIGSHTCTHPYLTSLETPALLAELKESRRHLEARFNTSIKSFAYPSGGVNERVASATKDSGYTLAFTTQSGINNEQTSPFKLRRTEVSASDLPFIFELKMQGVYDWLAFRETESYRRFLRFTNRLFDQKSSVKQNSVT